MKKLLLFIVLFSGMAAYGQSDKKPFSVTGYIKDTKDTVDKVFMVYRLDDNRVTDSAKVTDGKFVFNGSLAEPVKAMIYIKYASANPALSKMDYGRDALSLFVQPGTPVMLNSIKDSFALANIKGGELNAELKKIAIAEKWYDEKLSPLYDAYSAARKNKNKPLADSLEKQIDTIDSTKTEDVYGKYIKAHPASPIAIFILQDYAGYEINADKIEPLYNKLPAIQKNYYGGKKLKSQLEIAKLTGIGKTAPDFTQTDTLGNPISLASLRGKYILLDFWASWCGPCRRENPNVVAAYNKFKDKGFGIISVSLDQPGAKDKWMKAIHDDHLTWTHVSDLKFWDNAVAKQYGIQAIPQNLLIDPTGKIVAKNLEGEELEKKLSAMLAN